MKKYLLSASVLLLASCSLMEQKRTTSSEDPYSAEAVCKSVNTTREQAMATMNQIASAIPNIQDPKTKQLYTSYLAGIQQGLPKFNAEMDEGLKDCGRPNAWSSIYHRNQMYSNELFLPNNFMTAVNESIVFDKSCNKVKYLFQWQNPGAPPRLIQIKMKNNFFNTTDYGGPDYFFIESDYAAISLLYNSSSPLKVLCTKNEDGAISYDETANTLNVGYTSNPKVEVFENGILGRSPLHINKNREIDYAKLYNAIMSKIK